jgi:hypothetical protein
VFKDNFPKGQSMISKGLFAASAAFFCFTSPALADWSASPISLGANEPGAVGQVDCAPNGSFGSVWGTGTYTSDSSICTAAVHFGWIAQGQGGVVSFRQVQGLDSYEGSAQNGVTTFDYGAWDSSFQITGASPLDGGVQRIAWSDTADSLGIGDAAGEVFSYECLAEGAGGGSVWGTDVYTSDSSICAAAAHRGHVSPETGGQITLMVLGSQVAYGGTARNGVTTSDYPEWSRSFVFQN